MAITSSVRPRVFVSSTIYDFRDLRDALKYWLEEMAFEVQMSEYTNFDRRPEEGAFEACFRAIRESDYYVLLIGDRRGSMFSPADRVSVTQQEYRTAYESFQGTGRPRPVIFVREGVLAALAERRAANATTDSGSTLEDAEFTTSFIREVGREEETEKAKAGERGFPRGNWITGFTGFRDLMDGLRASLQITGPLPRVALEETLRQELSRNLRMMMVKHDGHAFYLHFFLDSVREEVQLSADDLDGAVKLSFQQIKRSHMYVTTGVPLPGVLIRTALDNAISAGHLLDYNAKAARYEPSPLLTGLFRLREALDVYAARYMGLAEIRGHLWPLWDAVRGSKADGEVPVLMLTSLFGLHDSQRDVVRLLLAILRILYGHSGAVDAQLRPVSPLLGEDEKIRAERVTQEEIEAWLSEDNAYLSVGTTDWTTEQEAQLQAAISFLRDELGDEAVEGIVRRVGDQAAAMFKRTPDEMRAVVKERLEERLSTTKDDDHTR